MNAHIYEELRHGHSPRITQHCMSGDCNNMIERVRFQPNGRCFECQKKQANKAYWKKKAFTKNKKVV